MVEKKQEDRITKEIKRAAYQTRLAHLRRGQECIAKNELAKAVENYLTYLKALETFFGVEEKNLSPKLFDKQKDLTELLLISHVYWDLSKAYDKNPKTLGECKRSLNQFVKFSIGFKYQRVNSDIIRKYIKKRLPRNEDLFKETYEKVRVETKGCYLATICYGSNHPTTQSLRSLRDSNIHRPLFFRFAQAYYKYSPAWINFSHNSPRIEKILRKLLLRPAIALFLRVMRIMHDQKN